MFESLVITLREGVEGALVLAIAIAILERRGLQRYKPALFAGAGLAIAASIVIGALASRLTYDEELAGGIAEIAGALLVGSLTWWMWRHGAGMKRAVEQGIERATGNEKRGDAAGIFLFSFVMLFREGVETAIFLSASGFNTAGIGRWLGALIGLVLAVWFGVLFERGALKVPLKPFFSLTTAVLALLAIQLLVGGLHELSEAEVLPSSRAEMAIIGPFVKNELLLFTLTVALAAVWMIASTRAMTMPAAAAGTGPEARLARAAHVHDLALRRWIGVVGLVVVGFLSTAFVHQSRVPERAPAIPVALESGVAHIDTGPLKDGHIHFFETTLPGGPAIRFFAIDVKGELRTCYDACVICGDKGYFEDAGAVVCRNCTSPIVITSLGRSGGCNPIPLPHVLEGGSLTITETELRRALPQLKGR